MQPATSTRNPLQGCSRGIGLWVISPSLELFPSFNSQTLSRALSIHLAFLCPLIITAFCHLLVFISLGNNSPLFLDSRGKMQSGGCGWGLASFSLYLKKKKKIPKTWGEKKKKKTQQQPQNNNNKKSAPEILQRVTAWYSHHIYKEAPLSKALSAPLRVILSLTVCWCLLASIYTKALAE